MAFLRAPLKMIERWAKATLPPRWIAAVRAAKAELRGDRTRVEAPLQQYYRSHKELNSAPRIVLRKGLSLAVDKACVEAFEYFCWRSRENVLEFDRFLGHARGKSRLLDIGACHGIFSLSFCALNPAGRAIAVDPSAIVADIVASNVEANGFDDRVVFLNCAAGRSGGTMRAVNNWHHVEASPAKDAPLAVPTRSIDEICQSHEFWPDLIKIDVEGFEKTVLEGAKEALAKQPVLLLEVHPRLLGELGSSDEAVFRCLEDSGYASYNLAGQKLDITAFKAQHKEMFHCTCLPGNGDPGRG